MKACVEVEDISIEELEELGYKPGDVLGDLVFKVNLYGDSYGDIGYDIDLVIVGIPPVPIPEFPLIIPVIIALILSLIHISSPRDRG